MSLATIPASVSVRSRLRGGAAGARAGADVVPIDRYRRVPAVAVREPAPAAPLRLTRRGRIVVRLLLAAAVLIVVLAGVLVDRTALGGSETRQIPVTQRVVMPGETLWQIAGEVAPGADRRDTVARIVELNDLSSPAVSAGQRIAVPADGR